MAKKSRIARRGKTRSIVKRWKSPKPHHWMKAKAIGAYLHRRRGLPIILSFSDLVYLTETFESTGVGQHTKQFADVFELSDTVSKGLALSRDEIFNVVELVSKDATFSHQEQLTFEDNTQLNLEYLLSDLVTVDEQLDKLFDLNPAIENLEFTESFNKAVENAISDVVNIEDIEGMVKETTSPLVNSLQFTESVVISKVLDALHNTESLSINDTILYSTTKGTNDVVDFVESVYFEIIRTFSETIYFLESVLISEGHGTQIQGSILVQEVLSLITTTGFNELPLEISDSTSLGFNSSVVEDSLFGEVYSTSTSKNLEHSLTITELIIVKVIRRVGLEDTVGITENFGIIIAKPLVEESVGITDDFSVIIGKNISDGVDLTETSIGKDTTMQAEDDLVISHNNVGDAIEGTFTNRKLGGEPFNNITFN